MRSLVAIVAVCVAGWSVAVGQAPNKPAEKFPITLSLKDKAAKPVDPKSAFPEVAYTKLPDSTLTDVPWVVEIDVVEDGKPKTYTITTFTEGKPKETMVSVAGKSGVITGKDGKLQDTVSLYVTFSKARGKGTLRLALADPAEFAAKQKDSTKKEPKKLSNWLEIPIQIDEMNEPVRATTGPTKLVRQAVPKKEGVPSADELAEQFANWWMLKARADYQRIHDDNLFSRALSRQPGSPAWLLAWSVARAVGPADKLHEKLQDEGKELKVRGDLFPTLSKEVNNKRFNLGTSILKATGDPKIALQFSKVNLAISEINLDIKAERWEKIAGELVKSEQTINDVLTPQLAKEIVEADALFAKSLTAEQAKMIQSVELLLHKRFVPAQATLTQSTTRLIEKATPQQLLDSRKKVRETFRKVLDDNPELLTDLRHGATVASASETEELKAARKQTQSRTQDATK